MPENGGPPAGNPFGIEPVPIANPEMLQELAGRLIKVFDEYLLELGDADIGLSANEVIVAASIFARYCGSEIAKAASSDDQRRILGVQGAMMLARCFKQGIGFEEEG